MSPKEKESAAVPALRQPLTRRQAINLLGGAAGSVLIAGCGGGGYGSGNYNGGGNGGGSCTKVAQETGGPFPADGSNTNGNGSAANALDDAGILRADIRSDTDGSDLQPGVPLTLTMTVQSLNNSCAALVGAYVYIWHANREGHYSQYSGGMNGGDFSANNFLRGVQQTDANGYVTFTTVMPGRYQGRATHIHFEVYPANSNLNLSQRIATSQLAFPDTVADQAATASGYSSANPTHNSQDNVFSDGTSTEMLTISGDNTNGYTASITVAVAA